VEFALLYFRECGRWLLRGLKLQRTADVAARAHSGSKLPPWHRRVRRITCEGNSMILVTGGAGLSARLCDGCFDGSQ